MELEMWANAQVMPPCRI